MFCAVKAARACEKEEGTSMMKPASLSETPAPAEAVTPILLTMAVINRKEMLTSTSEAAIGIPSRTIMPIW